MADGALVRFDKLAKVCGLLASSHDGERSAAAHRASAILQEFGWTWRELVEKAARGAVHEQVSGHAGSTDAEAVDLPVEWRAAVRVCRRAMWCLTPWEQRFLDGIAVRRAISAKQKAVRARCYAKAARAAS